MSIRAIANTLPPVVLLPSCLVLLLPVLAACLFTPRMAPSVAPATVRALHIDSDKLAHFRVSRRIPVVAGTDGTVAVTIPGPRPWEIAQADLTAGSEASVVEGFLESDAPLRFRQAGNIMRAESFDGSIVYEAPVHVTTDPPPDIDCCDWSERTLWRAAPGLLASGLLRAARGTLGEWSVLEWYLPGNIEPAWRIQLTDEEPGVVAAAVSPRADQILVVLADAKGESVVRALAPGDGHTLWTARLDKPAAGWWHSLEGRMVYSFDGSRFAVLVWDADRCPTCDAISVFESRTGKHIRTVALKENLSTEYASLGIAGNTVWIFTHVPAQRGHRFSSPESCAYEVHDLSTGAYRSIQQTAPEWGLESCWTFALLPRFGKDGVVALAESYGNFVVMFSDRAP